MSLLLPDLDKMSEAERIELAAKLRRDAEREEAAAEVAQQQAKSAQEAYHRHCDRAYNLRVTARAVEQYGKT